MMHFKILSDIWSCNKSEVSRQKLPPFKICWPAWTLLSWSQTTKNAEKLRVANLTGWHYSGAVCSCCRLLHGHPTSKSIKSSTKPISRGERNIAGPSYPPPYCNNNRGQDIRYDGEGKVRGFVFQQVERARFWEPCGGWTAPQHSVDSFIC